MKDRRRKAVVFLDDGGRQATLFDPFAAALKRRGLATLRLTIATPSWARALRDRLFYSEVLCLAATGGDHRLPARLARYEIVDVQLGEATLAELGLRSDLVRGLARVALSCAAAPPAELFDKFELNARLAEAGVLVPPQIAASAADPQAAADTLGTPYMVKRRVAEGGRGVLLAAGPAEAEAGLARWGAAAEDVFFQGHVPGELVMYGALVGDKGPLVERCFRATGYQKPCGPSAGVTLHHEPAAMRAGRAVASALGVRGLVQFDFIQDPAGRLWHIDANARCWGSMLAASAAGVGFLPAYVGLVTGSALRGLDLPSGEGQVGVQPHTLLAAAATGSWAEFAAAWPAFARFCRTGPGAAYWGLIGLKAIGLHAGALLRRRPSPAAAAASARSSKPALSSSSADI
ncbi:hypothetical protein [Phenylobacterium sp.]|uniref:hypothetical protein n=1 Tax=Phenylobacterium sp. TaxID=1871053 RepID=UPI0035B42CEF